MCGRYALHGSKTRKPGDPLAFHDKTVDFEPHFNIPPMQELPVYCVDAQQGARLTVMRWGFVPAWAREPGKGAPLNNARAETVAVKPAFRAAYRQRRCLVPMNGFYEWNRSGSQKLPYYVQMRNEELFAVAGLYECWPGNADAPAMMTFTVLTTAANALMAPIHDRMPVIVPPAAYEDWLDPRNTGARGLEPLLQPYPAEAMLAHPVSPRVNSVRNDDAALMEALSASAILDQTAKPKPIPIQGQLL
jgi:putative SOS response-associated peptidase YedK